MKRKLVIRLSIVAAVVALGTLAIVQALRTDVDAATAKAAMAAEAEADDAPEPAGLAPIPDPDQDRPTALRPPPPMASTEPRPHAFAHDPYALDDDFDDDFDGDDFDDERSYPNAQLGGPVADPYAADPQAAEAPVSAGVPPRTTLNPLAITHDPYAPAPVAPAGYGQYAEPRRSSGSRPTPSVAHDPDERQADPSRDHDATSEDEHPGYAAYDDEEYDGQEGQAGYGAAAGQSDSSYGSQTYGGAYAPPPAVSGTPYRYSLDDEQPLEPAAMDDGHDEHGDYADSHNSHADSLPARQSGPLDDGGQPLDAAGAAMPLPLAAPAADVLAATSSRPGGRELEGSITPSLTLEKIAPQELQVNRPARFETKVKNTGLVAARQVVVVDRVPEGTELLETVPEAARAGDVLMWQLGRLDPGQEVSVSMQLRPRVEGRIGSVASLLFQVQATAASDSRQPVLTVRHSPAQQQVLVGEDVTFQIEITNTGTGPATNVVVEEDVPEGLRHPIAQQLEFEIGTLQPNESRSVQLTLRADKPGAVDNVLVVRADGDIVVRDQSALTVVAPQIQLSLGGPRTRFLDRQAVYELVVANEGTAPATNIDLVSYLPKGLSFIGTDAHGQYDPQQHAVFWNLEQLPPGQSGVVELAVLPVEMGEQLLRVEGRADLGLTASHEHKVTVDGLAELRFTITDLADPVEVNSETTYEILVANSGSKAATNIHLSAQLPEGLEPIDGTGATTAQVSPGEVVFQPLAQLAPGDEARFRVRALGVQPGDQRIRVALRSDQLEQPVVKEESTRVYADR